MTDKPKNKKEELKVEIPPPDFARKVKEAYSSFSERPHVALETALIILVFISFAAVIITWISGLPDSTGSQEVQEVALDNLNKERLKIPLILFGATTIALLVMVTGKGFALLISVLVIGTIVAQEQFLLSVVHMFSKTTEPIESYYYDTYEDKTGKVEKNIQERGMVHSQKSEEIRYTIPAMREKVTQTIREKLELVVAEEAKKSGATEDLDKFADQVAKRAVKLADAEIKVILTEGIETIVSGTSGMPPDEARRYRYLKSVVEYFKTFERVVEKHGNLPDFDRDMSELKRKGYITCRNNDWASCTPSEAGSALIKNTIE